jgi:benzoylformate decarboxylase
MRLLHISDDPGETGRAPIGDSLLGDAVLSLAALTDLLAGRPRPTGRRPHASSRRRRRRTGPETAYPPRTRSRR